MKYNFKDRDEMIAMYNSIQTPHSHGIVLDGNSIIIEWDGSEPEQWKQYKAEYKAKKKNDKDK
tara:strand:- start:116 stop:304 length:189 start_codon:yes stop_codon:yes gene_type:complete